MKVILLNGSPHEHGNTADALSYVREELEAQGIETSLYWIGIKAVHGCIACGKCRTLKHCIFGDDIVNPMIKELKESDGLIVASPVYYASANGTVTSILDRFFYAAPAEDKAHKVGAAIAVARRAGTTATFDMLNKYFTISEMPIASSIYWNEIHGRTPGETKEDAEGIFTLKRLAKNMAWMLKSFECAKEHDISAPEADPSRPFTHFVR